MLAVLRPWIDVGNVGTLALRRLERHLESKEIGRLVRPGRFYDFTRYRPKSVIKEGVREYSIPSTTVSVCVRERSPDIITLHLLEPHLYGEDYTDSVIEVLKHFGVKRYSMIGAMYDMVPHTPGPHLLFFGVSVRARGGVRTCPYPLLPRKERKVRSPDVPIISGGRPSTMSEMGALVRRPKLYGLHS